MLNNEGTPGTGWCCGLTFIQLAYKWNIKQHEYRIRYPWSDPHFEADFLFKFRWASGKITQKYDLYLAKTVTVCEAMIDLQSILTTLDCLNHAFICVSDWTLNKITAVSCSMCPNFGTIISQIVATRIKIASDSFQSLALNDWSCEWSEEGLHFIFCIFSCVSAGITAETQHFKTNYIYLSNGNTMMADRGKRYIIPKHFHWEKSAALKEYTYI